LTNTTKRHQITITTYICRADWWDSRSARSSAVVDFVPLVVRPAATKARQQRASKQKM